MTMMNSQPPQPPPLQPQSSPLPASAGRPLTPEHLHALTLADGRAKKLRKAASVANFNAMCLWVFSGLSLLVAAVAAAGGDFDLLTTVIGVALGLLAWNESRGRRLLRQFDLRAPAVLGWNQAGLLVLIVAYAAWKLHLAQTEVTEVDQAMKGMDPNVTQMMGNVGDMVKRLMTIGYALVIALTVIFQGLNSLYYFSRAKLLRQYLAQTPSWVVQLQRHQAGGQ